MVNVDFRNWFDAPAHSDVLLHIHSDVMASDHDLKEPMPSCNSSDDDRPAGIGRKRRRKGAGAAARKSKRRQTAAEKQRPLTGVHGPGQPSIRTYHAHAVILCAQSAYFNTGLSNTWQQPQQQVQQVQQPQPQQQHKRRQRSRERGSDVGDAGSGTCARDAGTSSDALNHQLPAGVRYQLTEAVGADQAEAMDLLLRLMYGHDLPGSASLQLLFQCLWLADRYEAASGIVDTLLARLAAITNSAAELDPIVLSHVSTAPPGIAARLSFQPLLHACKRAFINAPAVIKSESRTQQFLSLPFAMVLVWASSDELEVHSENCVVFLLSHWIANAQKPGGQGVSGEQLEQLAHKVRVLHLGRAYQYHILPHLPWFKTCSGMQHLPTLLAYKGTKMSHTVGTTAVFPGPEFGPSAAQWRGPEAWVAAPRRPHNHSSASEKGAFTWILGPADLDKLRTGNQALISTTTMYANGFLFNLRLKAYAGPEPGQPAGAGAGAVTAANDGDAGVQGDVDAAADAPAQTDASAAARRAGRAAAAPTAPATSYTLGLHYGFKTSAMTQRGLTLPHPVSVMVGATYLYIQKPSGVFIKKGWASTRLRECVCQGVELWGFKDCVGTAAPSVRQLLEPYLADGELRIGATLAAVD